MLICVKCGVKNELGRVFCNACGSRLNLAMMTSDAVAEDQRLSFVAAHYRKAIGVAVALVVLAVGMALWPVTAPLGEQGTAAGSGNVQRRIETMVRLRQGQSLTGEFAEKDVNGYLRYQRVRQAGRVESCSVKFFPQGFAVRIVRSLGAWSLGPVSLTPKLSYDIRCVPVDKRLVVTAGSIGHLPLGPMKKLAVGPFVDFFAGSKESDLLRAAQDIRVEAGKANVTVSR